MKDSGNIKIIQTVASGGTAVMFKAVQTSLDRIVAVKRLHPHLTEDENFTRRFILEAKAAASLDHENIVHVIDFGLVDDCYQMVMEFVEGESLKDILERWRPVKYDLALAVVYQVLMGLEHAHAKGIVHRDIKPGNIMLTDYGKAKITDFGLAKLTQSVQSHTADNAILGTPLYMSPEQAFGESVDQRSDLFSLGTVLYELLTGRQPFASNNYVGVIQNIINRDIPDMCDLVPEIPDEVEAIAKKALAKNREDRFQNAREFRATILDYFGLERLNEATANLRVLLQKQTVTQVLPSPMMPAKSRRRKRSAGGFAAVLVFLLLAVGTAAVLTNPHLLDLLRGERGARGVQTASQADPNVFHFDLDALAEAERPDTAKPVPAAASAKPEKKTAAPAQQDPAPASDPPPATPTQERAAPRQEPTPKPKPRLGYLTINADPSAEIYIDGVYQGDTPPALKLTLGAGEHKVECRHPRYESYSEVIKIVNGELSRRSVTLRKLKGTISLATQEGAELYIDGALVGVTPIMRPIEVEAGRHLLTIKKTGYFAWSSEVTVEANKTLPLKIVLSERY
ncbi:MAG: protein kinase [Candidatus Krumholzibacteria bacterium]|nr:protein kinase [Candidatus Krumholzibacteria bacterium]